MAQLPYIFFVETTRITDNVFFHYCMLLDDIPTLVRFIQILSFQTLLNTVASFPNLALSQNMAIFLSKPQLEKQLC